MYNIGQYQYKNTQQYIIDKDYSENYKPTSITVNNQLHFYNKCINVINNPLESTESYYLYFKIKKMESKQVIILKLENDNNTNNYQQIIKQYEIQSSSSTDDDYVSFEVVFTPNTQYNQIVWELQRTGYDYTMTEDEKTEIEGNLVDGRVTTIEDIKLSIITNIITENKKLTKIGIQGPPSLLMCINGQQIRLGRNGIYEINNGILINFVGFVPHDNDYFLMDYEYIERED